MRTPFSGAVAFLWLWALTQTAWCQVRDVDEAEGGSSSKKPAAESSVDEQPEIAASIVERTNTFRRQKGRQPVETNAALTEAAAYFAEYMARTNRYGHTADGQRPSQRAKNHEYDYCIVSENIAYQYSSAGFETSELVKRFMKGWKTSPGHRKNMLDRDVTETGVAVAQSSETGYIYAVQMFGRPKSASITFQVANRSDTMVEYQIGERSLSLPPSYTRTHKRCRPTEMTFTWQADSQRQSKTVEPDDGDEVVISEKQERLNIRLESADAAAESSP